MYNTVEFEKGLKHDFGDDKSSEMGILTGTEMCNDLGKQLGGDLRHEFKKKKLKSELVVEDE